MEPTVGLLHEANSYPVFVPETSVLEAPSNPETEVVPPVPVLLTVRV